MQWTFENYRLDTDNAALWRDGVQVRLRPKTYDVLQFLVEHAGDLVRKEELLDAVWKNSFVVEGVLTTSMSELRKLFGDTAKNQRYISTVYRRGYRFVATVNELEAEIRQIDSESAGSTGDGNDSPGISTFPRLRTMVGREQECEHLINQIVDEPDCRILSLVGQGGIGKTHLAVMIVRILAERDSHPFEDGFCFVQLQSLEQVEDFCSDINDALELQSGGEESPQQHLQNYLLNKRMLLLIDNFEYYLKSKHVLTELISAAPGIKLLVTSRESLNIPDAWFHSVNGLVYSDSVDSEAVRVFAFLAKRNQPAFDVNEKLPVVLRICEMVEGMPLALELAASWLKMLSLDEVAGEIAEGLDFLEDQFGGENERQGSVRAVFNETWQRLTESERTLLKQFSLFRSGADRAAISEVIGAGLPILARLVNKALLYTTQNMRYRMHELIRQFAEEELRADKAFETEARNQHAEYYLNFLADQHVPLGSDQQGNVCREILADFDNIHNAWYWAVTQKRIELIEKSMASLSFFCDVRGQFYDGLAMFEVARSMIESSDYPQKELLIGRIKMRAGILNFRLSRYDTALALFNEVQLLSELEYEQVYVLRFLGDYQFSNSGFFTAEQVKTYLEECVQRCDHSGIVDIKVEVFCQLSILYTNQIVDTERSYQYAAEAVELSREIGSPDLLAYALHVYAWSCNLRGEYAEAEKLWLEGLDIADKAGNRRHKALSTNWLGWSAWCVGGERLEQASELFTDALTQYQNLGDRANVSMTYADLATVLMEQGDFDQARECCQKGMALAREIGRDDHHVYNFYVLGAIECAAGNLVLARSHLSKSLQLAWEQEEQTNKPVVVFYVIQLLYSEYRENPEAASSDTLSNILTVLLFLQIYPLTWQAIKDRAQQLQQSIETEIGSKPFAAMSKLSDKKITDAALKIIPDLLG
jgi:DNA-binding winged helix-turn-helix (wHTH) protein/predicted ATPase